jgi:hypothetical protein
MRPNQLLLLIWVLLQVTHALQVNLEISNNGFRIRLPNEPNTQYFKVTVRLKSQSQVNTDSIPLNYGGILQGRSTRYFLLQNSSNRKYNGQDLKLEVANNTDNAAALYSVDFRLLCTCKDDFLVTYPIPSSSVYNVSNGDGRPIPVCSFRQSGDFFIRSVWIIDTLCGTGYNYYIARPTQEFHTSALRLYDDVDSRIFNRGAFILNSRTYDYSLQSPTKIYISGISGNYYYPLQCGTRFNFFHQYNDPGGLYYFGMQAVIKDFVPASEISFVTNTDPRSPVCTDFNPTPAPVTSNPTTTFAPIPGPVTIISGNHSFFQLFANSENFTYDEASKFCMQQSISGKSGSLATFRDSSDMELFISIVSKVTTMWIGLRRTPYPYREFDYWTDGSGLTFTSWAKNEPNDLNENEDCVALMSGPKTWVDVPCNTRLQGTLCKFEYTTSPTHRPSRSPSKIPTTSSPTKSPAVSASNLGFKSLPDSVDSHAKAVEACKATINKNGVPGKLAVIRTEEEMRHVQELLGFYNPHWVGMKRLDRYINNKISTNKQYHWMDWSDITVATKYWNREVQYPMGDIYEDCVCYNQIRQFEPTACDENKYNAPKPLCRYESVFPAMNVNRSIYQTFLTSKWMNFDEASTFCSLQSQSIPSKGLVKGRLAVVWNATDLQRLRLTVESELNQEKLPLWLGAKGSKNNPALLKSWIDGVPFEYSMFDPDATSNDTSPICLALNPDLFYDRISCSTSLQGAVCEFPLIASPPGTEESDSLSSLSSSAVLAAVITPIMLVIAITYLIARSKSRRLSPTSSPATGGLERPSRPAPGPERPVRPPPSPHPEPDVPVVPSEVPHAILVGATEEPNLPSPHEAEVPGAILVHENNPSPTVTMPIHRRPSTNDNPNIYLEVYDEETDTSRWFNTITGEISLVPPSTLDLA